MHKSGIIRNLMLGINSLMLHKLRSGLTMLGMVFGVGSVVAMLSVGQGASREAMHQIRKLGSTNIIIYSQKPVEEQQISATTTRSRTSIYGLLYEDEKRIAETCPMVVRSVGAKIIQKEARLGERAMDVRLVGTTPDWFDLIQRRIVAGRTLNTQDMIDFSGVCVLSEETARRLLAGEHTIGQPLRVGGEYFRVVGIVHTEPGAGAGVQTPDQAIDIYIPLNVARQRFGDTFTKRASGSFQREKVELHQLIIQVAGTNDVEPAEKTIRTMLGRFHKKNDYRIAVPLALLRQAKATRRIFNIVLGSIAGISLLVGGIGIMNIMLANVTERTSEIGIRRAIGAKRRQIVGQFLIETVVLSSVGGLIGVILGLIIPSMVEYFAGMPTVVTLWSVLLSLSISVAVGIIFGLYPAYRAASVDPIIALRHE